MSLKVSLGKKELFRESKEEKSKTHTTFSNSEGRRHIFKGSTYLLQSLLVICFVSLL